MIFSIDIIVYELWLFIGENHGFLLPATGTECCMVEHVPLIYIK